MFELGWNLESLLLTIPLIGMLFARFFHLDEEMGKRKRQMQGGRNLTDWDQDGRPICTDPGSGAGKRKTPVPRPRVVPGIDSDGMELPPEAR